MSILFSDIRDFTTISEQLTPADNFKFLNSYLGRMEAAIAYNNGFIDKYIGDAIMALFSNNADEAVQAGILMLKMLAAYNQQPVEAGRSPVRI
ncbi:adenylate/guanylate cyclase domain-containing protein, partial [Arthrospira sp. PCC 8006]